MSTVSLRPWSEDSHYASDILLISHLAVPAHRKGIRLNGATPDEGHQETIYYLVTLPSAVIPLSLIGFAFCCEYKFGRCR
jgi:hypothetical protein